uniref:Uncharacterized protein n=1 Tax=Sphaerodactylus townsendi TaxID=933632 RepID=A0ACB8FQ03_9SAUR
MTSCEDPVNWVTLTKASFVFLLTSTVQGEETLGFTGFVQNRCWPSVGSDENVQATLDGSEQRTVYQRPPSIWGKCVNYKQQGLNTICSALNDVILTLKLFETHLTKDCVLYYIELSPVL